MPMIIETVAILLYLVSVTNAISDWSTYGFDQQRTGLNPTEVSITVNTWKVLKRVWSFNTVGGVLGQPVVVSNYDMSNSNPFYGRRRLQKMSNKDSSRVNSGKRKLQTAPIAPSRIPSRSPNYVGPRGPLFCPYRLTATGTIAGGNQCISCQLCGDGSRCLPCTTSVPTSAPAVTAAVISSNPSSQTIVLTQSPSYAPSTTTPSLSPSIQPVTISPSGVPSKAPATTTPTFSPSDQPTQTPTTWIPSFTPSDMPSQAPITASPSVIPTKLPTSLPSQVPTYFPSQSPILPYSFLGCYGDRTFHAMDLKLGTGMASIAQCFSLASVNGYRYFSLEAGTDCYGSANITQATKYGLCPNSIGAVVACACNRKCKVGLPDLCGGNFASQLYDITPPPTTAPTLAPSANTTVPSVIPSHAPSLNPTVTPSSKPSALPTKVPSVNTGINTATINPTNIITSTPYITPSAPPTQIPTNQSITAITNAPTVVPSQIPTNQPFAAVTNAPTVVPSQIPTNQPFAAITNAPTVVPSQTPTNQPVTAVTKAPTSIPTRAPFSSIGVSVAYFGDESGWFYALDLVTGFVYWKTFLGNTKILFCADLNAGDYSISGTAVFDRVINTVYVVGGAGSFNALSMVTGAVLWNVINFYQPQHVHSYGALLLHNKIVYATMGGICDLGGVYLGGIYAVDTVTRLATYFFHPYQGGPATAHGGGIWGLGGVTLGDLQTPATTAIYTPTGNCQGQPEGASFCEGIVKLDISLNVLGFVQPPKGLLTDNDFGSSVTYFNGLTEGQTSGCKIPLVAAYRKDGMYVVATADTLTPKLMMYLGPSKGSGAIQQAAWDPFSNTLVVPQGMGLKATATAPAVVSSVLGFRLNATCSINRVWSTPLSSMSSPTIIGPVGGRLVLVTTGFGLNAIDVQTGVNLGVKNLIGTAMNAPVVVNGTVLMGTLGAPVTQRGLDAWRWW